ncbi:hypothetical protein HUG10_20465 (plasmid) [Halorarum halophilum]|uniref:Uncharacterized protein n=1 Tax=Halorarum halophilum TaxID=2743090 RepID=A0A7D5L333_9EURY|nr:hypothetical protein [Halobaculum halophilum]QLG29983.1 hypothetical protein HUG10_20465 [Halobaculum halophilum]
MADAITTNSWIWTDTGTEPTPGDENYVAGDQPIAEYDNWAMWAVTSDVDALNAKLGSHASFHEAGGQDELDLVDMSVGTAITLAEPTAGTFELQTPGGTSLATLDTAGNAWTTFPDIDSDVTFKDGLTLGGSTSITFSDDAGTQTLADLSVTSTPASGTEESYSFAVDGTDIIKLYAEADGVGGIQNAEFAVLEELTIATGKTVTLGDDLVAADGEVIWDESAGVINGAALEDGEITLTAGNALTGGGTIPLGGSASIGVASDSIQTSELDLSITPTWTGTHVFDSGLRLGDGQSIKFVNNAGAEHLAQMNVTASVAAGTEESMAFRFNATDVLKLYTESDGSGGIQNTAIQALVPLDMSSTDLVDGATTIWDASAGHVPAASVEDAWVDVGGDTMSGDLNLGGNNITGLGTVDGVDVSAHAGDTSAHHAKYTDSEAVAAVNAESSLSVSITGDADTVDGWHANSFVRDNTNNVLDGSLEIVGVAGAFTMGLGTDTRLRYDSSSGTSSHRDAFFQFHNDFNDTNAFRMGVVGGEFELTNYVDGTTFTFNTGIDIYNESTLSTETVATQQWVESDATVTNADDADTLDGFHSTYFAPKSGFDSHTGDTNNPHGVTASQVGVVAAVNAESVLTVDIDGDADTLDGSHASAFATAGHNHDSEYVDLNGDIMAGTLNMDQNETTNFVLENRTSDPASPVEGQMWVRSDL